MPERATAASPPRPSPRNPQFPPRAVNKSPATRPLKPKPPAPAGRILGLDYGARRIGVAVGNAATGAAQAVATVAARDGVPDWRALQKHIDVWQPAALAVGVPLNMDGSDSAMAKRARAFGRQAGRRFGLTVAFVDERLTTRAAEDLLQAAAAARGGRRAPGKLARMRVQQRDSIAAELIARDYLAESARAPARASSRSEPPPADV